MYVVEIAPIRSAELMERKSTSKQEIIIKNQHTHYSYSRFFLDSGKC